MLRKERLRFRNERTFEEADPPQDRREALKWRRSFNSVSLPLQKPVVDVIFTVNDVDALGREEDGENTSGAVQALIRPALKRRLRISATVDASEVRDTLYVTSKTDEDGVFALHRPKGPMRVDLVERDGSEENSLYAAGSYKGIVFVNEFDLEEAEPHFHFELAVPTQVIEQLVAELRRDSGLSLEVGVEIRSFSYEVDDALREWYHPRDLFIHGTSSPAPLSGLHTYREKPIAPDEAEVQEEHEPPKPIGAPESAASRTPSTSDPLRGIRLALWTIATILFLSLFT